MVHTAFKTDNMAGCPGDTRRDKHGVYRPVSQALPVVYYRFLEKLTEKGIFAGTPAGCPRDTWPSREFSEFLFDFILCVFSAP